MLHTTLISLQNALIASSKSYACKKLSNDVTVAPDESAMLQLAITFTGDNDCDDAETFAKAAAKTITEFISQQLANYPTAHIESNEFYTQQLIHGYAYTVQVSHFASIICTDCTVYITLTVYPQ